MPAPSRTATCSSRMPAYWTGISQPANGTRRAPAATWRSYSGVRLSVSAPAAMRTRTLAALPCGRCGGCEWRCACLPGPRGRPGERRRRPSAELPAALGYVPTDATAVAIVPTDVEGEQLQPPATACSSPTLREAEPATRRGATSSRRCSSTGQRRLRAAERRPLLGMSLVHRRLRHDGAVRARPARRDARRRARAGAGARRASTAYRARRRHAPTSTFDGGGDRDARERARASIPPRSPARYGDEADDDALVELTRRPDLIAPSSTSDADLPWIAGAAVASRACGSTRTRSSRAPACRHRPGRPQPGRPAARRPAKTPPRRGDVDGALNVANRNQSRTTSSSPSSRARPTPTRRSSRGRGARGRPRHLVRGRGAAAVRRAEREHRLARRRRSRAVSEIADPDRMRELLPRLAPRLPAILRGLQGLGNQGAHRAAARSRPTRRWSRARCRCCRTGHRRPSALRASDLYEISGPRRVRERLRRPAASSSA